MKKPSKPPQSEQASERTKRFSLPNAQTKLSTKIQVALLDGLAKGLSRDLVSERENLVVAAKRRENGKLDSSLTDDPAKRPASRSGSARGRKSITTLMPSRDLTANLQQFNSMVPLVGKIRDAYSFKSTSSDDDTRSSFATTLANGHQSDTDTSTHVNGRRGRHFKESSLAPSELSSAAESDTRACRVQLTASPVKALTKKYSKSSVELLAKPAGSIPKASRRKSLGPMRVTTATRPDSPAGETKRRQGRKSLGSIKIAAVKPEPEEAPPIALRPSRKSMQDKELTARSRSRSQEPADEAATKRSTKKKSKAEDPDESTDEIELEYTYLQKGALSIKKVSVCAHCEMADSSVKDCEGPCQRSFHPLCLGILDLQDVDSSVRCAECSTGAHPCFMCKEIVKEPADPIRKCSQASCTHYYHESCVKSREGLFRRDNKSATFTCPAHACRTCWTETLESAQSRNKSMMEEESNNDGGEENNSAANKSALALKAQKGKLVRCIRCPTAYHSNERCLAAGSVALGGSHIVCPNHFKPIKKEMNHRHMNVNWCFACCQPGELIGCNKCPAAYHYECIEHAPPELLESFREYVRTLRLAKEKKNAAKSAADAESSKTFVDAQQHSPSASSVVSNVTATSTSTTLEFNWTCEECLVDKRPCYGDIVWAKVGQYRWWPGQIVHPRNLPDKLREKWHQVGEFPVKFFGTHDHYWMNTGRCFTFAPEDDCQTAALVGSAFIKAFKRSVVQARLACTRLLELKRSLLENDKSKRGGTGGALKQAKLDFQYIRTNRPYGNVIVHRIPIADYPHCECDPKSASPCSTDDCVNRALKYECHPARCPAGDRCQNQRFVKRQYPKQAPLKTGDGRGYGLVCQQDIKKGEFVNEYVGELIDDDECKRRLHEACLNDVRNFYFLTIDKDRIIDAGPKGNLARFMNHSCEPNVETQKWMVNGDVRVGLFAVADIAAGTELTFNYNLDCLSNEKAVCRCGAKNCSGFIGDRPKNSAASTASADQSNGNPRKRKLSEAPTTVSKSKKTVNGTNAGGSNNKQTPGRRKSLSAVTLKSTSAR